MVALSVEPLDAARDLTRLAAIIAASFACAAVAWRLVTEVQRRRGEATLARWMPVLLQSLDGSPANVPPLRRRDRMTVLVAWNHFRASLRGSSAERLNAIAHRAGLYLAAEQLLRRGREDRRLVAAVTLGHLRVPAAWHRLTQMASEGDRTLSGTAAKALSEIDPHRAGREVIPALIARRDWDAATVASVLRHAGAGIAAAALEEIAMHAGPSEVPRLIKHLEATRTAWALPLVRRTLRSTADAEVIAACLHALGHFRDPSDAAMVRPFLDDRTPFVRVQAVTALGRCGDAEDLPELARVLGDRDWWVRYRAARALVGLRSITAAELDHVARTHHDRFARDALTLAMAESHRTAGAA